MSQLRNQSLANKYFSHTTHGLAVLDTKNKMVHTQAPLLQSLQKKIFVPKDFKMHHGN